MNSFSQLISTATRRLSKESFLILLPGVAGLLLIDVNFGIFRGEFTIEDVVNFNTMVVYYVDKLDLTDTQQIPYGLVMFFVVYFLGYFLHASSKYFVGPKRFRLFLKVKDTEDEITLPLTPTVKEFLQLKEGDLPHNAGAEACLALIDAAGIPSQVSHYENRSGLYRSLGYLFFLLALMDVALFLVAFDYSQMMMKFSICLINIVFAFLFFKGQEETSMRWKEQICAEALVAVNRLKH